MSEVTQISSQQTEPRLCSESSVPRFSHFGSQVALTFMTNLFLSGIGLVTGSLTARLLGPAGRGELASIQVWGAFVATIALCGLSDAVIYFSSRDPAQTGRYWMSSTYCSFLCGLPILLLGNWCVPHMLIGQSKAVITILPLYTTVFFFSSALISLSLGAVRGTGSFFVWNTLRVLPQTGWAVVVVYAFVFRQVEVPILVTWFLVSYVVATFIIVGVMLRRVSVPFSLNVGLWPHLVRYGLPSVTGNIPGQLMQSGRIAQLFMAVVLDPTAVGLLAVGVALGDAIRMLPAAIASVVFPRVAAVQTEQQHTELARGTRLTVLLTGIAAAGAIVTCPLTVPLLFGQDFQAAVPVAMLMAVGGSLEGLKMVLGGGIRGLGRPSVILSSEFTAVVTTAVALVIFLPLWGVTGAALALTVGNVPAVLILIRSVKDITSYSSRTLLQPTAADLRLVLASTLRGWDVMRTIVVRPL